MDEKVSEVLEEKKIDEVMLPGFRFHPTDEELVGFYLKRKIQQRPLSIELIKQLDIYKYDPWDLPKFASTGEKEWYFYCPRDRKYRNSARPNRVTGAGFWKATGTDRPIYSSEGSKCIGLKKSLVFYKGRAAKGVKTDWMMHEFRLPSLADSALPKRCLDKGFPANDSWAICRIFKKTSPITPRTFSHSWISSPNMPNPSPSSYKLLSNSCNNSNLLTSKSIIRATSFTSPKQANCNNNHDFPNFLLSPNTFTPLDNISNNYNPNFTSPNDNLFPNISSLLDLPPSYFLPQLEDPSETSKSTNIDVSSMLLNMSSSVFDNMEFSTMPDNLNGQCHELSPISTLSQDHYHQQKRVNIFDHSNNCDNDEQDLSSTLLGNLENVLYSEGDNVQNWEDISGFLPLAIPETWKSSSSLLWDCAPPLS